MSIISTVSTLSPKIKRKLVYATLAITTTILIGTFGFHYLENLSFRESIYLSTATVTTVGYGDIVPKTPNGQAFTTVFMVAGVGTVLYALSVMAQAFIQSEVIGALGIRRRTKEMENLEDHYIVCGAGRVGKRIIVSLRKENTPFVVIERDEDKLANLEFSGKEFALVADATLDKNLRAAGVQKAKGLVTCLADDAANVYVVLTARNLNQNLHIVSRAVEEQAEPKLIQAGANRVVSPLIIGSMSMSRALLKPAIADFMETIVAEHLDLVFEEIIIGNRSPYVGKMLKDTNISNELNLLIVAIRQNDGLMTFNPLATTRILNGDLLIVVGNAENMQKLIETQK